MPFSVRYFFWTVAAVAAYWLFSAALRIAFPPPYLAAALSRAPANFLYVSILAPAVFRSVLFLLPAWLAAFYRQNWARWAVVVVFVANEVGFLALMAFTHHMNTYLQSWVSLKSDAIKLVLLSAIAFSFSGNARDYFSRRARNRR